MYNMYKSDELHIYKIIFIYFSCITKISLAATIPPEVLRELNTLKGTLDFNSCTKKYQDLDRHVNQRIPYTKPVYFNVIWNGEGSERGQREAISCYNYTFETFMEPHPTSNRHKFKRVDLSKFKLPANNGYLFKSYSATIGIYKILYSTKKTDLCKDPRIRTLPKDVKNEVCYFWISPMQPTLMIKGGTYREIPIKTPINVDIICHDPNDKQISPIDFNINFRWAVMVKRKKKSSGSTKEASFTLPNTYPQNTDLVLKVWADLLDDKKKPRQLNLYQQEIKVVGPNRIPLLINCLKNCPPFTLRNNYQSETYLQVECLSSCDDIKYTWTILIDKNNKRNWIPIPNFNYETDTSYGQHTERFIIKKRVLKQTHLTTNYKIEIAATGPKGRAGATFMTLNFASPGVSDCEITPEKGISFKTKFKYDCSVASKEGSTRLELFLDHPDEGGKIIHTGLYPDVTNVSVFLPPSENHKFFVKGSFHNERVFDIVEVTDITVTPLFNKETSSNSVVQKMKDLYSKGDRSIEKLITSTNPDDRNEALGTLTLLMENIKTSNSDDKKIKGAVEDMKYKLSQDLSKAPLENFKDIMQVGDVIVSTMDIDQKENGSDPFLYEITQMVCKKLAQNQLSFMQKEKYQQTFDFEAGYAADKLTQCTEMNAMPNQTAIEPIELNLTTVIPTVTGGIVENYPDYEDYNEEYYRNLYRYKEATDCAVNTTILSAKVIALTMASGEDTLKKTFGKAEILVAKDKGSSLCNRSIQSQGVKIIPSADWKNSDHDFDILISTWSRDIMWWNPNHTKISSDIIKIEFWHSTCKDRVNGFKEPADLIFKLNENGTKHVLIDDSIDIHGNMSIFRVKLNIGEMLRIVFYNLTKSDFLDVTITIDSIPMIEDFENNITITQNSTIHYANPYKKIDYAYVGILPSANMTSKSTINYTMSYLAVVCVTWETATSQWIPQCHVGPKSNLTHMNCRCNNFSIISTNIMPVVAIKVKLVVEKDFFMLLQSRYIIFGTVFLVFAMYSGFCALFFKQHPEEVFFLADNQESHEYGYVVIIRTGSGSHASTSSNVIIKLTGNKAVSEPHLLNYPDPQMRILQRNNEDIFILTTPTSLGDQIIQLELWYDSIGFNATWYCQDVYVYDLQTRTHWYFKVKKQLCVVSGVSYIAVGCNEPDGNSKKKKHRWCTIRMKVCDITHAWLFLHEEENFTRFERLTMLLSNIMLTFLLVMIWHPLPQFQLNDCFDQRTEFRIDGTTVMKGTLCALTSFGIHFCILWTIRLLKHGSKANLVIARICWILVFLNIFGSTNALVIFGFWIPFYSSLEWLIASSIGLAFSAIFFENILIMFRTMFNFRWKPDLMWRYNLIMKAIEKQKAWLFHTFGPTLLRPYFGHLYVPMTEEQEHIRKVTILRRRLVLEQLWDFVMFSIYILILYMVVLMNKSSVSQISNANMKNEIDGGLTRTMSFTGITTFLGVYDYIEQTLIPILQDPHWYGNFVLADPGLMVDLNNKYLGVVRLRQHRMPKGLCAVSDKMAFLNMSCWPEFELSFAETGSFGYRWEKVKKYLLFDRLRSIWDYTTSTKAGTLPILGTFATYSGGGYVTFLGRTYHNSVANFRQIKEKHWIDDQTRAIFIEFLTYNDNHNEFNAITMTFEQSATGYLNKKVEVQTARMLFIEGAFETIKRVIFGLFIIWVLLLVLKQSSTFVKKIKSFYKDIWFFIDFFIISMSAVCIGTFYIRTRLIEAYLDKLKVAKHNEFVNYFELFYLEDFLTIFGAVLICVATIRMWRFLRFGKVFRMMERTISLSGGGLVSVLLLHAIFILAYAMSGIMLYEIEFADFYSIMAAVRTLMMLVLFASYVDYDDYIRSDPISYFFFGTYSLVVIVIMTLYGIMLMEAYVRAQLQFAEEEDGYTIKHYFQEKLKYWPLKWHYKFITLKGGNDGTERTIINLKSGDVRYENSISIEASKLEEVASYARCILKNLHKPKGKNQVFPKEMMSIVKIHLNKLKEKIKRQEEDEADEGENEEVTFFTGHLPGEKIKCIDENRILLVKSTVERLLRAPKTTPSKIITNVKIQRYMDIIKKNGKTLKRSELNLHATLVKFDKFKYDLEEKLKKS